MPLSATLRLACSVALFLAPAAAQALTVPPGCAEPPAAPGGHRFYVDPEKGDKANDGSAARPWRTLAEVLDPANHLIATHAYLKYSSGDRTLSDINPNGPIKPGDTIVLMSGDHGAPVVSGYFNDKFITVESGPGQHPRVGLMWLAGSSRWVFRGVKFESVSNVDLPNSGSIIDVGRSNFFGPTENIVFDSNTITSGDDVSAWTDEDWVKKPLYYGLSAKGACTTLFNNHFVNLRNAIAIADSADHTNVERNLIEHFGNDGIDETASDVTIRGNIIRYSRHSAKEPLHADGIQGWTAKDATNKNVVIDSNMVINTPAFGDYLQGISVFDGKWDGLSVTNNVVVTNAWHGIALYGVTNAKIINNTVVPSNPKKFPTWIMVHDSKDKTPSKNVIVRNNIAAQLIVTGQDVTLDHNMLQTSITIGSNNKTEVFKKGAVDSSNVIDPYIYVTLKEIDNIRGEYDLHLKNDSRAVGSGNTDGAPTLDITGKSRVSPADIGAYAR